MDVYVLDELFRRESVIDNFESLIWTERFSDIGDFELVVASTPEIRRVLTVETYLSIARSTRVMVIETVENKTDADGVTTLTATGRSIESIMEQRLATVAMGPTTSDTKWYITAAPATAARAIFEYIFILKRLNVSDGIPRLFMGNYFYGSNIPEPVPLGDVAIKPQSVYSAIKGICDAYGLGFRLIRGAENGDIGPEMFFNIYSGNDRTSQQSTLMPILFSPDLDNMSETAELTSIKEYKNVAYVLSPFGSAVVYATGAGAETTGFSRRVLYVDATDITEAPANIAAVLNQRGKEALAANRSLVAFDGEIRQTVSYAYKYDQAYYLGDLVEMRNTDGAINVMRVTEQIFVSDQEGDREYPTLSINRYIAPGSWLSWAANRVWSEALGMWIEA